MALQHGARLLRSVLYLPASNMKMVEKAATLRACDAFIFDCEDAVSRDLKDQAREGAKHAVKTMAGGKERTVVVRVNGVDTPWFEQDCLAAKDADAVLLPKAERVEDLEKVRKLVGNKPDLWSMIETPLGVLNARELGKHCKVLVMGTVDLANELGCSTDPKLKRAPLMTSLQMTVLAARACGIQALDGVYIHLSDDAGFAEECEQGVQLGFDGKTIIHPKTIEAANKAFSPSEATVTHAQRIVTAYENSPKGATLLDGRLVEELHVRRALKTIDFSKNIQKRMGSS